MEENNKRRSEHYDHSDLMYFVLENLNFKHEDVMLSVLAESVAEEEIYYFDKDGKMTGSNPNSVIRSLWDYGFIEYSGDRTDTKEQYDNVKVNITSRGMEALDTHNLLTAIKNYLSCQIDMQSDNLMRMKKIGKILRKE